MLQVKEYYQRRGNNLFNGKITIENDKSLSSSYNLHEECNFVLRVRKRNVTLIEFFTR